MKNKTPLKMTFEELQEIALCISQCGLVEVEAIDYIEKVAAGFLAKRKGPKTCVVEKYSNVISLKTSDKHVLFTHFIEDENHFHFLMNGEFIAMVKIKKIPQFKDRLEAAYGPLALTLELGMPLRMPF
jgi:hypothetical protein